MLGNLNGWHLIILLVVILLLFGAAKLPALAKSMGQSARVFKGEMKAMKEDDAKTAGVAQSTDAADARSSDAAAPAAAPSTTDGTADKKP
jgi:sec-independent protein translocase protein TatA